MKFVIIAPEIPTKKWTDSFKKLYPQIPILIGGGFKGKSDIDIFYNHASAVVISSALHYKKVSLSDLLEQRNSLSYKNFNKK